LPFGVQCVPDRSTALTSCMRSLRLHCLSAFSAFPTHRTSFGEVAGLPASPLPFGVQCVPDRLHTTNGEGHSWSPLPFGVQCVPDTPISSPPSALRRRLHCLSAFSAFPTRSGGGQGIPDQPGLHCLSAFSAFPTRAAGRERVHGLAGLHCLSAFSAFPT